MSIGKIVILEGTSCVGKTTLCESLAAQGWIVLPEAIRYLEDETGIFVLINPKQKAEIRKDADFKVTVNAVQEINVPELNDDYLE